ncbi:3174_t:CDS:2 [Funneliformis mosseae]|uniref:3174_t:CDS:1 n=1 Tax=Funneliformis mosseae TaxID=27381 RepID=A0A9N9AYK6_FUNMO|nr:3174_t:CDS:2 [Funneliformis mosseae]
MTPSGTLASQQNTSHHILTLEGNNKRNIVNTNQSMLETVKNLQGRVHNLWASDFTEIIDDNKSNVPVCSITKNMPIEPIDNSHEEQQLIDKDDDTLADNDDCSSQLRKRVKVISKLRGKNKASSIEA